MTTRPALLHKYVAPERIDVLRSGRIRFTQPDALNDPFELKPFFSAIASNKTIFDSLDISQADFEPVMRKQYASLPASQRAAVPLPVFLAAARHMMSTPEGRKQLNDIKAQFSGAIAETTPQLREQLFDILATKLGILSLSAVPDSTKMWSYYAAQHRGAVLTFDANHSFFDQRKSPADDLRHIRPVVYKSPDPSRFFMDLDGTEVTSVKRPEWSDEQEWRMVVPLESATAKLEVASEDVYLFDWPSDCLRSVTAGAKSSPAFRSDLQTVLSEPRYSHVSFSVAEIDLVSGRVTCSAWGAP